ncbi:MAG: hypothetical protein ABSG37_09940 [Candidatus Limnocylindrales bacterium]|jgi:hypothetical protein
MVRHLLRQVVRHGHWADFIVAYKAWNEAGVKVGLPAYRLYSSEWGTFNEAFAEAEYQDSGDIERRYKAAMDDPAFNEALGVLVGHLVDAQARDYVLSEVKLI